MMNKWLVIFVSFFFVFLQSKAYAKAPILVSNTAALQSAVLDAKPGDRILLRSGIYRDVKLEIHNSGTVGDSIKIDAEIPGEVIFSGDVKIGIYGEYIVLSNLFFKDGARNPQQWRSHGPGLIALYGSYNRITNCVFYDFDNAQSAYITTSLPKSGKVPQYCRIDHCAFVGKKTMDQVVNFNNSPSAIISKKEEILPAIPMYHRLDHCYFSNPPKKGNAGGAIRIGYWRKDYGRCLVDSNLFERQDSEAEIITGKSMENVYYHNAFVNCRGTLNFRHGDKQVAINNYFIGTDKKYEYGGMFVWGSNHIIACNYFFLPRTIKNRGEAALYLNSGEIASEHAPAYDMTIVHNSFVNIGGYDVHFSPLYERRKEAYPTTIKLPYDIRFIGNLFYSNLNLPFTAFCDEHNVYDKQTFSDNYIWGLPSGLSGATGIITKKMTVVKINNLPYVEQNNVVQNKNFSLPYNEIEGIPYNFRKLTAQGNTQTPVQRKDVGPLWTHSIPYLYDYADLKVQ